MNNETVCNFSRFKLAIGSFSTTSGKVGNSFVFPSFSMKLEFPEDAQDANLFLFNPKFQHCAEKVLMEKGESSFLFSIYSKCLGKQSCGKN